MIYNFTNYKLFLIYNLGPGTEIREIRSFLLNMNYNK